MVVGWGMLPPVRVGTVGIWFSASVRVWEGSSSKPRPAGEEKAEIQAQEAAMEDPIGQKETSKQATGPGF